MRRAAAVALLSTLVLAPYASDAQSSRAVVVATKPFGESYLLGEMFAQLLEAHGYRVDRRPGLGATEIAFGALRSGAIDVYPEYTGTGLRAILGDSATHPRGDVLGIVSREFSARWGVRWLPPLGFENTYAIAVRRETAERDRLHTLSDLARVARRLRAGFTPDFIGRVDGLPGLQRAYGIEPREVRSLLPAVKYRALASGDVDVIDGYSTDGLIARYDLVVLRDDRGFFPPYEAAALVGARLQRDEPAAVSALTLLSDRLDDSTMRVLNRRVEVDGEPVSRVAHDELATLGLVGVPGATGAAVHIGKERGGLIADLRDHSAEIWRLTERHILLVLISLLVGILVAVPIGVALERAPRAAEPVLRTLGALQTIPSMALLAFMIPLLGIGVVPALVALWLYSLYPMARSAYAGVRAADPGAVLAARALGMTESQILRYVRLPLAMPIVMAGIRTAAVIDVGTATLAAFIGAGGLGDPIVAGLALSDTHMIMRGAIPAAVLALVIDGALGWGERAVRPVR